MIKGLLVLPRRNTELSQRRQT